MNTKYAWGLLLLALNGWARDPFFPPGEQRCQTTVPAELEWRLLGIIGRGPRYDAWLRSPEGTLQRQQPGSRLSDTNWRVARVEEWAVTLTPIQDCQPPLRLALKGRQDAENILAVADTD